MLKIVEFIHEHKDWEELLTGAPYYLTIKWKNNFVLFKYNQINSDFNQEICREARGLILDASNNFEIVRYSFKKFFNYGERFADNINWNCFTCNEKQDGTLISVWHKNGWHVSTMNTIDAEDASLNSCECKNFKDLFDIAAKKVGLSLNSLSPSYCYTFELVGPLNRIVVQYPETTLYHLSTRDMLTLDEVDVNIGVPKPKTYEASSLEDVKAIVAAMDDTHEGIVIRDSLGQRVKLKTETYFRLHRLAHNKQITDEYIMDIILRNDVAEFSVYFPELADKVVPLQTFYSYAKKKWRAAEKDFKEKYPNQTAEDRKKLAAQIVGYWDAAALFSAFSQKIDTFISRQTAAQWVTLYKKWLNNK